MRFFLFSKALVMVFGLKYIHLIWPILSVLSKEALNLDLSIWSLLVCFFTLVPFFSKDILLKSNIRKYYLIKMFWNLCRENFPVAVFAAVFWKVFLTSHQDSTQKNFSCFFLVRCKVLNSQQLSFSWNLNLMNPLSSFGRNSIS